MSQDPAPGLSLAVATAPSTTASSSADPFVRNLVLIIVVSVATSAWLLAYTDWFGEISALFALGGLFTWVGVISKLLTEARTNQLQAWVENAVFGSRTLARRLATLAIALVALASFTGTIEVRSQGDPSNRLLRFDYDARSDRDRRSPGARGARPGAMGDHVVVARAVRVKVSGYPSLVRPSAPGSASNWCLPARSS